VTSFDNQAFWDARYREDLSLGSGAGSRGEHLERKRRMLQNLITGLRPRSIIDVGCGDIEATRDLQFDGAYLGIDVSPYIVERNRQIRPDWSFLHGDFVALAGERAFKADLVVCLDVLIHQHDPAVYRAFVAALLRAAAASLVVNGFSRLPRGRELSPNVAFHEPIVETLRACGARRMTKLADVRRTTVLFVDTRHVAGAKRD
jgi:trans-aconitate methyltransferase